MVGYGASFGLFVLTASSFITPIRVSFDWTTGQASILPLSSLTMAVLFPFAGRLIDRWGARRFAIGGMVGFALCYLALAVCPPNILLYRGIAVLIGFCGAACGPLTFSRGIGSWFVANRGAALGLLLSGLSLGGLIGIPFAGYLIEHHGWRGAYIGLATSILLVGLPAVVGFFRERAVAPPLPVTPNGPAPVTHGLPFAQAVRDKRFWMLLVAFAFSALPIGVFSTHLLPILAGRGFSSGQAVSLGAIFAASIGISRIGIGVLLDRLRDHVVAATCMTAAGVGAYLLFHTEGSFALLQAQATIILIGLAYGAEGDMAAYFTLRLFGLRAFSSITGCFSSAIAIGLATGGYVGSIVVDKTGAYDPLAPFMAVSLMIAGSLIFGQRYAGRRSAVVRPNVGVTSPDYQEG